MLKKAALTFSLTLLNVAAYADTCGTALGNTTIEKTTLQCMTITGKGTFNMAGVMGKLTVTGSLDATKSNFSSLDITGDVTMDKSTVAAASKIIGALNANYTSFMGDLTLDSQSVKLTGCNTKNILVQPSRKKETTTFVLTNSTVSGDITFANGNGVVQSNHSTITGKVIGGTVQQ